VVRLFRQAVLPETGVRHLIYGAVLKSNQESTRREIATKPKPKRLSGNSIIS